MSDDDKRDITYNAALEELIAKEAERCAGLSWMHTKAEAYYSIRNTAVQLPTIVLSTLVGFLSGSSSQILFYLLFHIFFDSKKESLDVHHL